MARSNGIHRLVDFCIGVPFIAALSVFRKRSKLPENIWRIGIICPTAIGDLILASGLLVRIHDRFPRAEIHVFHGKSNRGALTLLPVDVVGHECDFKKLHLVVGDIRARRLDVVVDVTPWPRATAIAACLSGAVSVGYRTRRQFRHFAFDVAVSHLGTRHEVENLRGIADLFGVDSEYRAAVRESSAVRELGVAWEKCVICHPCPGGSRANEKRWPNDRWVELVERLTSAGYEVVFTGIGADNAVVESITARFSGDRSKVRSLCGKISLEEMCYALRRCRLFITVDTGVMHMASLMEIPAVALMGPTDFRRWGARSRNCISLQSKHPRAGYISLGFESCAEAAEIMSAIEVEEVFAAAVNLLQCSRRRVNPV